MAEPDRPINPADTATLRRALLLLGTYRSTGHQANLWQAHEILAGELGRLHPGTFERAAFLDTFNRVERDLFELTGQRRYIDAAVEAGSEAVRILALDAPDRVSSLNNLAQAFADRYEFAGHLDDLRHAEDGYRAALSIAPEVPALLGGLGTVLEHFYEQVGDLAYLREAVSLCWRAVAASGSDVSQLAMAENELANMLASLYDATSDRGLLDEATVTARAAAAHSGVRFDHHALYLNQKATMLRRVAMLNAKPELLDEAEAALVEALSTLPAGHNLRSGVLLTMANVCFDRHRITGDATWIDRAIDLALEVLHTIDTDQINFGGLLVTLANALNERYAVTGARSALVTAIDLLEQSLAVLSEHDAFRPMLRSTLGGCLLSRAQGAPDEKRAEDIAAGVAHLRAALAEAPPESTHRPTLANNLALGLCEEFNETRDRTVLTEAADLCIQYLGSDVKPGGEAFLLLTNTLSLAALRGVRAGGPLSDLDRPEQLLRRTLSDDRWIERGRWTLAGNLAEILALRARLDAGSVSRQERTALYRELSTMPSAPTAERISAFVGLANLAVAAGDWVGANAEYAAALALMADLSPRSWRPSDRRHTLSRFFALASDAAACALNAGEPHRAVDFLETGRGVVIEYPRQEAKVLARLARAAPDLAQRYREIADEIAAEREYRFATKERDRFASAIDVRTRQHWHDRMQAVLAEIRALGGEFGGFLRPLSCIELLARLRDRTVVLLNVSEIRSDALVLHAGKVTTIPLSLLRTNALRQQTIAFLIAIENTSRRLDEPSDPGELAAVMDWLWQTAVSPVLTALGHGPADPATVERRRVWWCPTGLLSLLPIHAAARQEFSWSSREPVRPTTDATIDRVASSYTPTVRALVEQITDSAVVETRPRLLAVGLSDTPELDKLPGAGREAMSALEVVGSGTLLVNEHATHANVVAELRAHNWLHFAGHGRQDPVRAEDAALYPFDHLAAGPLGSAEIAGLRLRNAELAFLSACSTASGRVDLADEPVSIAGAIQQAGYPHVIAALWPVSDAIAKSLSRAFYRELLAEPVKAAAAAVALHRAVRAERAERRRLSHHQLDLVLWAPYVHIGP